MTPQQEAILGLLRLRPGQVRSVYELAAIADSSSYAEAELVRVHIHALRRAGHTIRNYRGRGYAIPIAAAEHRGASPAVPVAPEGTAGASFANARTPFGLGLHHFEGQN